MPYYGFSDRLVHKNEPDQVSGELRFTQDYHQDVQYISKRSWISYGLGRKKINPCEQLVFSQKSTPWDGLATLPSNRSAIYHYSYSDVVTPETVLSKFLGSGAFPYPNLPEMIRATSVTKANDFSLVNFLVELDDLPSVFKGFDHFVQETGGAFFKPLAQATKKKVYGKKVKRDLGRLGLTVPLAQQFALGPLISDIASFGASIENAKRSLDNLNAIASQPTKLYGVRDYQVDQTVRIDPSDPRFLLRMSGSVHTYAGGEVTGRIDMSPELYRLKSMLDAAGFYVDGAVVWEAIPFSFLIDYVLPIGNWLEKARDPWIRPTFFPRRLWQAFKIEIVFEILWDQPVYSGPKFPYTLGIGTLKYYRRDPIFSVSLLPNAELPRLQLPSPRQGAVALALGLDKFVK